MKKVFYFISVFFLLISFTKVTLAQNIGSLRAVVTPGFSFTMDLRPGYTDQDVLELQRVLNADVDTTVTLDGDGSRGHEKKYFGDQTKQAVIKFQEKYRDTILTPNGLTSGTGFVGKSTRTKLNLLIGVMNTVDSTGSPESTGVTTTTIVTTTPVVVTQPSMSVCSFVELLINIQAINSNLAPRARSILGCTGSGPMVDVKVDGRDGPISLTSPGNVTVTWVSNNVTSCVGQSGSKSLSGSQSYYVNKSGTFTISCTGIYGSVTDSVSFRLASDNSSVSATCLANPTNGNLGATTTWQVDASGGDGDYTYSWSGTDNLTGTGYSVSKLYTATGTKMATVRVSSDGESDTANCTTVISATTTSTSTNKVMLSSGASGDMVTIRKMPSLDLKSKITLEAWVNPTRWATFSTTTQRSDNVIISKGEIGKHLDYVLSLDNGDLVFSNNNSALYTCSPVVPLNSWTHVAATVDETTSEVKLYVNGSEVASVCNGSLGVMNKANAITEVVDTIATSTTALVLTANRGNIHIGNFYMESCASTSKNGFVGKIDDVRVWNLARTASQIASSTTKLVSTSTGLVAEYTFDDSSFKDKTAFANNGYKKGSVSIVTDTSSPAPVLSSSVLGNMPDLPFSIDPDGACREPVVEIAPVEPESPPVYFAGLVTQVGRCELVGEDPNSNKYIQVVIKPCYGQEVSAGITGSNAGTVFIWPGRNLDVPEVGDVVLGEAEKDHNTICGDKTGPNAPPEGAKGIGHVTAIGNGAGGCDASVGLGGLSLIERIRQYLQNGGSIDGLSAYIQNQQNGGSANFGSGGSSSGETCSFGGHGFNGCQGKNITNCHESGGLTTCDVVN